jgi:dTDP-4-amino-4,6-dideoxygalactose transaminase
MKSALKTRLADFFERKHCVLVGRATTGLGVLFKAIGATEVVFPGYCCASPVYSTIYTGVTPYFCDVGGDFNISHSQLNDRVTQDIDAVVACDMWGVPIDARSIQDVCNEHDALLIEDAAQAVGSTQSSGCPPGTLGDASVVSFSHGKPIDAGGGGAILTDDSDLAAACRRVESTVPVRDDDEVRILHDLYTDLYWTIAEAELDSSQSATLFRALPRLFKTVYWRGFNDDWIPRIHDALERSEVELEARREQLHYYRRELADTAFQVWPHDPDIVPFAAVIRLKDPNLRASIRDQLVSLGHDAWWIEGPIAQRFGFDRPLPVSRKLYEQTLALPLGGGRDAKHLKMCATALRQAINASDAESAPVGKI